MTDAPSAERAVERAATHVEVAPGTPARAGAPATLRDGHTAATRARIVEAVVEVAANEHPTAFSVPAVAKAAGVSVRTVYRYFATKEDLLDALGQVGPTPLQLRVPEAVTIDEFRAALPGLFEDLHAIRDVLRQQLTNPVLREARERRTNRRAVAVRRDLHTELGGDLGAEDLERLTALVCAMTGSLVMLDLTEIFGLDPADAGACAAWALDALIAHAQHTKEVGHGPHRDSRPGHA